MPFAALVPISRARRFCTCPQRRLTCEANKATGERDARKSLAAICWRWNAMRPPFWFPGIRLGRRSGRLPPPPSPHGRDARRSIPNTVNRLYNLQPQAGVMEPNDMQFGSERAICGCWISKTPIKVFTIERRRPDSRAVQRADRIAFTAAASPMATAPGSSLRQRCVRGKPSTLKIDPGTGKTTLKKWETPGWGVYGVYTTRARQRRATCHWPRAAMA